MTDIVESAALKALLNYGQADEDGVMCIVSRQAVHEVADEIERLRAEKAELVEALKVVRAFFGMIRFDRDRDTLAAEAFDATRAALTRAQSDPHDSEGETG